MVKRDYHIHSSFCDGNNSLREIVEEAIKKGFEEIGFSSHSYLECDKEYTMSEEGTKEYIREVNKLKKEYENEISIKLGIELDYYSEIDTSEFDYVIGSVHNIKIGDKYIPIDLSKEEFEYATLKYFGGDVYLFAEKYFETVGDIYNKTKCDIIGHFDLFSKFNEKENLFSETDERYINAYKKALDKIGCKDKVFEINSGAMSRKYRTLPYPNKEIRKIIKEKGGQFILSSDSHNLESIGYKFQELEKICIKENLELQKII